MIKYPEQVRQASDRQLLEQIVPNPDVVERLMTHVDHDLLRLWGMQEDELSSIKGISKAKAKQLTAMFELGRRRRDTEFPQKAKVTSSADAFHLLYSRLQDLDIEEFWVIYLNRSNKVIEISRISFGGRDATVVDLRVLFTQALLKKATGVIMCHNHPSGTLRPSQPDVELTRKAKQSGDILGVSVLDHLIIAGSSYYSFADEGNL